MSTIFLRFDDEAAFLAALPDGVDVGPEMSLPDGIALSVIGTIYEVDDSDPEDVVTTPLPGWHVNATALPAGWDEHQLAYLPDTPLRVFG